jgi:hypothetical protein
MEEEEVEEEEVVAAVELDRVEVVDRELGSVAVAVVAVAVAVAVVAHRGPERAVEVVCWQLWLVQASYVP